jgi:transcriptional regulator with XRE-family HTH domain
MDERSVFARRLRAARESKGVSQKQLGILAGIDRFVASARINQYERGKHVPDLQTAQRLAAELHVPVSYLYEPEDDLAELIRVLGGCSPDRLRELLTQLQEG